MKDLKVITFIDNLTNIQYHDLGVADFRLGAFWVGLKKNGPILAFFKTDSDINLLNQGCFRLGWA